MENNNRKYVGRVKTKATKYGDIITVSLGPKDFQLLQADRNENGWVMFDLKLKKEGGYYGEIAPQYKPQAQPANAANDDLF